MSEANKKIFDEIAALVTESRNSNTSEIDLAETLEIVEKINAEDATVAMAVKAELPFVALAVDVIVETFRSGGRLFYLGAGTSGRLGVLDASECPPTFGVNSEMVQGIIAGGEKALTRAQEGVEDVRGGGIAELEKRELSSKDVLCGIAASRRTPYVLGALEYAKSVGAKTLFVTCTPRSELQADVDVAICPVVGPEVIMGSTRMKAGTATKMVLNMLTTASMVKLGKVYENMMVDLQMTSQKLVERSKRTVMLVTGVDYAEAERVLKLAGGHVKTALVMILADVPRQRANDLLKEKNGFVRLAIKNAF